MPVPQIDFSPLGELYNTYNQSQQQAARDQALAQLRQNPNMGYDEAARTLIGGGDVAGGSAIAGIYNQIQQRALAEKQLAETSRHSQATEGLGAATLEETRRQHQVTDLQPVKIGSDLSGDIYAVRDPTSPSGYRRIDASALGVAGQPGAALGARSGPPVPSGPKVWGDKEAEAAGLYDPQGAPSAAPAQPLTREQKATLTGDSFLKTVPGDMQSLIKGVANYEINPATFSNRGQRERVLAAVKQYDPSYNETEYGQRALTIKRFASGPQGDTLRSMNVGIDHLATLQDYADAMQNGDIRLVNAARNKFREQFGFDPGTNFNAVKAIVGSEVSKAIVGSRGALEDRKEIKEQLTNASSPAQLAGAITAYKKLMSGQVRGLQQQYESSGLKDFSKKLLPTTMKELGLSPDGTAAAPAAGNSTAPVDWQTYFGSK